MVNYKLLLKFQCFVKSKFFNISKFISYYENYLKKFVDIKEKVCMYIS